MYQIAWFSSTAESRNLTGQKTLTGREKHAIIFLDKAERRNPMDILDYESTLRPDWWLRQIAECDWIAGQYLHTLLTENRFHALCGEKARLLLLTDGTRLVSFCTYA